MEKTTFLMALVALFCLLGGAAALSCLNQNGDPVDWWITYKLPNVNGNSASQGGFGYAYTDPHTSLKITGESLADMGALGYTLKKIYSGSSGYIMWNDETPDGSVSSSRAHSKGVIGYAQSGGFFLRHSTPRFPPYKKSGYKGLPDEERIYGQTYLCTSLTVSELNRIAGQYLVMDLQVYDYNTPSYISASLNLSKMAQGEYLRNSPPQAINFKTTGGTLFWDFAKGKSCECDMWDMVSLSMRSNMDVLSWGRPLDPSTCPPDNRYAVQNIQSLAWGSQISYGETNEHSKWGITTNHKTLCIGDMNRMASQKKRGGGVSCFNQPTTAAAFAKLVSEVQTC